MWLRALFCLGLGFAFLFFDEVGRYDLRFAIRSTQPQSPRIVIVHLDSKDWSAIQGVSDNWVRSMKEFSAPTDANYWNAGIWNSLLTKILAQSPAKVGVTFFFNPQLSKPADSMTALTDSRVLWAGQLDNSGRPDLPLLANSYGYNVALVDLREDEDRILRRFTPPLAPIAHMCLKMAEALQSQPAHQFNLFMGENKLINFRGPAESWEHVTATQILNGEITPDLFTNKLVLIGSRSLSSHQFQTPLGTMNRAEILAQVIDNVVAERWITRLPKWLCTLYLLILVVGVVALLMTYPQTVAFVFLAWLAMGTTALSVWVFDTFYVWIPAFSTWALIFVTYVIFIGYQLTQKENQTWRLQQEKHLLSELDQLRNNFVSLISHDLKTPIAKIQAICDRLLAREARPEDVQDGLLNVRKESMELHRYIQSILQISRLESNSLEMRKEATDLNELVEKVIQQVQPLADDKRQTLLVELEPLFSIEIDSVLIQEVILNLVENAIKYTPNDGKIEVKTKEIDDRVIFDVKDSGPGIPLADRQRLFEKFFRGQFHQSPIKGTGLGLFLVKYFIELHGGEVFLESDVGKGTRVGFTLPL